MHLERAYCVWSILWLYTAHFHFNGCLWQFPLYSNLNNLLCTKSVETPAIDLALHCLLKSTKRTRPGRCGNDRVLGSLSLGALRCGLEQDTLSSAYYWFNPGRPETC